jgi:hypothetical protein
MKQEQPMTRCPSKPHAHTGLDTARVPSVALVAHPFFAPFLDREDGVHYPRYNGAVLLAPPGNAAASNEAKKLVTVAKLLGEAIPALSFTQGANHSEKFDGMKGNFNMNNIDPNEGPIFKNGWPASRDDTKWRHGDYLAVAYTFIFPLYDKIVEAGELHP